MATAASGGERAKKKRSPGCASVVAMKRSHISSRSDLGLGVQPARGDAHEGRAVRCVGPTDGNARRGLSACGPNGIRVMSGRGVLEGPRDEDAHRLRNAIETNVEWLLKAVW